MRKSSSKLSQNSQPVAKRQSTRNVVISKAMRVVDVVTRQEVRDKRLQQLEADNYGDELDTGNDDDAYVDSDVSADKRLSDVLDVLYNVLTFT